MKTFDRLDNEIGMYLVYVLVDLGTPGSFIYGDYSFSHRPFYVGMGNRDRPPRSAREDEKRRQYTSDHVVVAINKTFEEASELETSLITLIGMKINGDGPLENYVASHHGIIDNQALLESGRHATQNPENLEMYSELMTDLNNKMLAEGTHISQNPDARLRASERMYEMTKKQLEDGTHYSQTDHNKARYKKLQDDLIRTGYHHFQRNDEIRFQWLRDSTDGHELLAWECQPNLGDRNRFRVAKNFNNLMEYHNIDAKIEIIEKDGHKHTILKHGPNFTKDFVVDYEAAYIRWYGEDSK